MNCPTREPYRVLYAQRCGSRAAMRERLCLVMRQNGSSAPMPQFMRRGSGSTRETMPSSEVSSAGLAPGLLKRQGSRRMSLAESQHDDEDWSSDSARVLFDRASVAYHEALALRQRGAGGGLADRAAALVSLGSLALDRHKLSAVCAMAAFEEAAELLEVTEKKENKESASTEMSKTLPPTSPLSPLSPTTQARKSSISPADGLDGLLFEASARKAVSSTVAAWASGDTASGMHDANKEGRPSMSAATAGAVATAANSEARRELLAAHRHYQLAAELYRVALTPEHPRFAHALEGLAQVRISKVVLSLSMMPMITIHFCCSDRSHLQRQTSITKKLGKVVITMYRVRRVTPRARLLEHLLRMRSLLLALCMADWYMYAHDLD